MTSKFVHFSPDRPCILTTILVAEYSLLAASSNMCSIQRNRALYPASHTCVHVVIYIVPKKNMTLYFAASILSWGLPSYLDKWSSALCDKFHWYIILLLYVYVFSSDLFQMQVRCWEIIDQSLLNSSYKPMGPLWLWLPTTYMYILM